MLFINRELIYIKEINNFFIDKAGAFTQSKRVLRVTSSKLKKLITKTSPTNYQKFKGILTKREANETNTKPVYEISSERYFLNLHPSRKCNLSCKYCFKDVDYLPGSELSLETAQKAIDFLVDAYGVNAKQYVIDLSGSGEPLLNFDLIKQIADYASIKRNETGKEITIMFCTNGTLIDSEKAAYLATAYKFLLGISLDGDKKQNVNRLYANGVDAYDDIIKGTNALSSISIGYAITITNENEAVDEIYDFIYSFSNCDAISMMPVRDYTDGAHSFYKIDVANLLGHYEMLCQNIIKHLSDGDYEYLYKILKGSDTFGNYVNKIIAKGLLQPFRCDAGYNRISVDSDGGIYACPVMNGCEEFKIGNVSEGINIERVQCINKFVDDVTDECAKCWAAYVCSGPCTAESYYATGAINKVDENICDFKRSLISLAIGFVCELEHNSAVDFPQIQQFIASTRNFTEANYGAWALFWLLKHRNITVKFEDLVNSLAQDQFGTPILEIENYIEQMDSEISIYKIEDAKSYSDVLYPAIAFINKVETSVYTYCLLLGEHEGGLKIKTVNNSEVGTIDKNVFLKDYSDIVIF